jgi:hypothetical protein
MLSSLIGKTQGDAIGMAAAEGRGMVRLSIERSASANYHQNWPAATERARSVVFRSESHFWRQNSKSL